jgi:hypothetical protein
MVGSFGSFLLLSGFVCLSQSIGRAGSEFQTVISEADDGRELGLFSFSFPALFVCYKAWGTLGQVQSFKP